MNAKNFNEIQEKLEEKISKRCKKRKMQISGKSVFELKKIIEKKSKNSKS